MLRIKSTTARKEIIMILKHYLLFTLLPGLLFFYEASAESDNTCPATEEIKTICRYD